MKQLFGSVLSLLLLASPTLADETVVRLDDPQVFLPDAIAKMVNIRFSDGFAAAHKLKTDYDGASISEAPEGQVCLFIGDDGPDPADPLISGLIRENGDFCVPRSEVSARLNETGVDGAPPVPIYHTFLGGCSWQWTSGGGVGLWTEDCKLDQDHWAIGYDAANDWFALTFNGETPYPVVRPFRLGPGETMDTLLDRMKKTGLVLDDRECLLEPADTIAAPAGWSLFEVAPTGARKEAFDTFNSGDEVPDPPCGDLGFAVDYTGFFAVQDAHPGRVIHFDLGQDGTMIAPFTVRFD